jgi:hypothetical protein
MNVHDFIDGIAYCRAISSGICGLARRSFSGSRTGFSGGRRQSRARRLEESFLDQSQVSYRRPIAGGLRVCWIDYAVAFRRRLLMSFVGRCAHSGQTSFWNLRRHAHIIFTAELCRPVHSSSHRAQDSENNHDVADQLHVGIPCSKEQSLEAT